jgi:GNAT superfamily N-acetyltransferase
MIHVRMMQSGDVGTAVEAMIAAGAGDRRRPFDFYLGCWVCHPFVALCDDRVVATVVATFHGDVAWLGELFVAPAFRGRGVAAHLCAAVIDRLDASGCRTIVAAAGSAGQRLGERLGFTAAGVYRVFEGPPTEGAPGEVRPLTNDDHLQDVFDLDHAATGEDRSILLSECIRYGVSIVAVDGVVTGYHVGTPWGDASVVARTPEAAAPLMALRRRSRGPDQNRVVIRVPHDNDDAARTLVAASYREIERRTRLERGCPYQWRPSMVWSTFDGALG